MPMTTFKVPKGFKPTPAIIKANPTVKQFSTGQVVNLPYTPQIKDRQSNYTSYVQQAFAGTNRVTNQSTIAPAIGTPSAFSPTVAPLFGTQNKPIVPTGSFLAANGTIAQGGAGVNYQAVAVPATVAPVAAAPIYNPNYGSGVRSTDNFEAMKQEYRANAGRDAVRWWVRGGGGRGATAAVPKVGGNAVNTGVNWRIG